MVDTCFKFIQTQRMNNTMSEPLWQWCVRGGSSVETMYHISGRMSTVEKEVHVWGQGIHGYLVFSTQFCYEPKISLKKIKFIKFIKSILLQDVTYFISCLHLMTGSWATTDITSAWPLVTSTEPKWNSISNPVIFLLFYAAWPLVSLSSSLS